MNCLNCNQEIPDGTKFCPYCGTRQIGNAQQEVNAQKEMNAQSEMNAQPETSAQPEMNAQPEASAQPHTYTPYSQAGQGAPYREPGVNPASSQGGPYAQGGQPYGQGGSYEQSPQGRQAPDSQNTVNAVPYLIAAFISVLCCCLPLGIVGLVYSVKISNMTAAGNTEEARRAAKKAGIWIIAAFAVGILFDILAFVLVFVSEIFDGYYGGIFDVIYSLKNLL